MNTDYNLGPGHMVGPPGYLQHLLGTEDTGTVLGPGLSTIVGRPSGTVVVMVVVTGVRPTVLVGRGTESGVGGRGCYGVRGEGRVG